MDGLFWTSRRHWWERVNNTVTEFQHSMTSRSSRERTRAARLIDRDSNDCAISPPPFQVIIRKTRITSISYSQFQVKIYLSVRLLKQPYERHLLCHNSWSHFSSRTFPWYNLMDFFIILMSLFSICRVCRDRQNPGNGAQCLTLTTDS